MAAAAQGRALLQLGCVATKYPTQGKPMPGKLHLTEEGEGLTPAPTWTPTLTLSRTKTFTLPAS